MRQYKILTAILCLLLLLTGCSGNTDAKDDTKIPSNTESSGANSVTDSVTPPPAPNASSGRPTRPVTTTVTLADNNIAVNGNGASVNGNTLTISADGVYEVSGGALRRTDRH